jgi:hypothetical protein
MRRNTSYLAWATPATGFTALPETDVTVADLLDRNTPILLRYYSEKRLFSDEARQVFVEADLEPLPPLTRA